MSCRRRHAHRTRRAARAWAPLLAGLALVVAGSASAESIPGPPLGGVEPGAWCPPRGDGEGLGAAGFAGAVAAIALVARRRRDPA